METGEIAGHDLATRYRVRRWFDLAPRIGANLFLKLHSHGALESTDPMLNGGLQQLFELVNEEAGRRRLQLFYATAWQMRTRYYGFK